MKYKLILISFSILLIFSCKKVESEIPEEEIGGENPDTVKKDSGYVVIYTNDLIYTDPVAGSVSTDNVEISINSESKGKISYLSNTAKPFYGTKNTLSLKLPVGNIIIKGLTTSKVSRSANASVPKNDTIKVKLDYAYNDPNKNSYFIEYSDNGTQKRFTSRLSGWKFYLSDPQNGYSTFFSSPGCTVPKKGYYDGPAYKSEIITSPTSDVILCFLRSSWKLKPLTGAYTISPKTYDAVFQNNTGSLVFNFNGDAIDCSKSDSYATVNVADVKIIEDMGFEKRGYYTGTFDAVIYHSAAFGVPPTKRIISNGKFSLPIGEIIR